MSLARSNANKGRLSCRFVVGTIQNTTHNKVMELALEGLHWFAITLWATGQLPYNNVACLQYCHAPVQVTAVTILASCVCLRSLSHPTEIAMASGSSGVMSSAGFWMRQLLTTVVRRRLKATSSVLSSCRCRHQSTNVDEDDQVVVVDSKRLDATSRTQLGDHIDRQVRSSGNPLSDPIEMLCRSEESYSYRR